jgi:hypothetical protein
LRAISALGEHGAGSLVEQRLDRFSRDPFGAAMAEIELVKFGAKVTGLGRAKRCRSCSRS